MPAQPSYRSRRARYEIDHCEPQRLAIQSGKIDFHALTKGHYPGTPIPGNVLPGLNSIGFWDAGGVQDWGLNPHRNEGIEIMFLETGVMDFVVDEGRHKLRAGSFTVTRPWQLHKLGAPNIGPGRLHWLILDVGVRRPHQDWHWPKWAVLTRDDLAELTRKLRGNEHPVWNASSEISAAFRGLSRCVQNWSQPHTESRMLTLLNQLLLGILTALTEQQTQQQNSELTSRRRTVELFLCDLENGTSSCTKPWTLGRMAAQCGMGITAFSQYCRELVNVSPVEFLNQCRLDHAARRMRKQPGSPITEIALESGFNSSQYFATAFRKRFKTTPRAYRNQPNVPRRPAKSASRNATAGSA